MVRHHHDINPRVAELFHRRRGLASAMCILCTRAAYTGKLRGSLKLLHDEMCTTTTTVNTPIAAAATTAADITATAITTAAATVTADHNSCRYCCCYCYCCSCWNTEH
jgi:hypothetical protein